MFCYFLLKDILYYLQLINYTCLSLLIILAIQRIFKLYIKDKVNLNITKLVDVNLNNKINYFSNNFITLSIINIRNCYLKAQYPQIYFYVY